VGDIFGAPLAVEGIVAFFMESTFIAVMFFGWNKVGKKFHLASTWLVAAGANLSALWILVANSWMENPVGMVFNPDTVRNEMESFWAVLFNPVAVDKFLHTISSGFVLASVFVSGISAWFLLKKRNEAFARKSILIAGTFGLLSSLLLAFTGDSSARTIAQVQPVKFAAFEALYDGRDNAPIVAFGVLKKSGEKIGKKDVNEFLFAIEIPELLSIMTAGDKNAYVPGLKDHINGNPERGILSTAEKIERGKIARRALTDYNTAKEENNTARLTELKEKFGNADFRDNYFKYFGFAFIENPEDVIPDVYGAFYAFHLMVILGFWFILVFSLSIFFLYSGKLHKYSWFLWIMILTIPLAYIASELGWILTEVGRQPWLIQNLMPVSVGVSRISSGSVQITFWLFAFLFTALLIAEISIMLRQIKNGPNHREEIK
jgi:cytochrome bd ubiquinol oxidase subunit I